MTTRVEPTLHDYLRAFARQFWPMFWALFAAVMIALAVAYGMTPVYTSSGTLLFESSDIPEEMMQTTVASNRDDIRNTLAGRVLRGSSIREIVEEYGLYPALGGADDETTMALRVSEFRSATTLTPVQEEVFVARQGRFVMQPVGFRVSYEHRDPETAQRVARELVDRFVAENATMRTEAAGATTEFIAREAERLSEEVDQWERRLAEFKREYSDYQPELDGTVRNALDRTEADITRLRQNLRTLDEREINLRTQLLQLEPRIAQTRGGREELSTDPRTRLAQLQAEFVRLSAIYTPEHPDIRRLRRNIEQTQRQAGVTTTVLDVTDELMAREAELDEARQRYSSDHPDVQRLERTVADLRNRIDQMADEGGSPGSANNPAYIQVQGQIEMVAVERQGIREQIAELEERVRRYDDRLQRMPEVSRELAELNRGHQFATQRYEEARQRVARARSAVTLETEMRGERLAVSSGPQVPEQPSRPHRPITIFIGLMLGLTVGGGLGAMREVLDTSVRGGRDVRNILEVPPLASIPYLETTVDRRRRWGRAALSVAVLVVSVGIIVTLYRMNA